MVVGAVHDVLPRRKARAEIRRHVHVRDGCKPRLDLLMQSVRQYGRIACRRRDVHRPGGKQNRQRDPLRLQLLTQSRQRRQTCRDVRFIVVIRVLRPLGAAPVGVEQPPHLLTVAPVQHAAAFPAPQRQIQRCRKADALVPQGELVGAVIREGGSEGAVQTAG